MPNLLSTPEELNYQSDGRVLCSQSAPTTFVVAVTVLCATNTF